MAEVEESSKRQTLISQHLRPILRPNLTTEPLTTQAPYSYSTSDSRTAELCPPHWRRAKQRGVRHKLKGILLKDLQSYKFKSPPSSSPDKRPAMMRMKDSDDYITARAANPRTGLISPSVGTLSSRPPPTPESPAEALKWKDDHPPSPTPDVKARPALRRAFEGRKGRTKGVAKWSMNDDGWSTNASVASPRITAADADTDLCISKSHPHLADDAFMVHMPSAREPQPYAYPGYSAKEIDAFEYYRQKARRVSSEGYDRRILIRDQNVSAYPGGIQQDLQHAKTRGAKENESQAQMFTRTPFDAIRTVKTRPAQQTLRTSNDDMHCFGGAELQTASFAPFSSPRTPAPHFGPELTTALKTIHKPAPGSPVLRKPLPHDDHHTPPTADSSPDLRHLPLIRLIHPLHASSPRNPAQGHRQCSLGCDKDASTSLCVPFRLAAGHDATTSASPSLFAGVAQPSVGKGEQGDGQASQRGVQGVEAGRTSVLADILIAGMIILVPLRIMKWVCVGG
ncbi:uncharacterized protein LTR77_007861 [Saxophila tyrrhenica]|uniref:Uncharacterized protein n=1 Tax=Saxophila tyrrhenica TaxID=1690608 RepID=A0AAV9P3Q5_9PEZI|nr:hypothetical protein LTR77_007861 [Saxophila tyrrhenica]